MKIIMTYSIRVLLLFILKLVFWYSMEVMQNSIQLGGSGGSNCGGEGGGGSSSRSQQ